MHGWTDTLIRQRDARWCELQFLLNVVLCLSDTSDSSQQFFPSPWSSSKNNIIVHRKVKENWVKKFFLFIRFFIALSPRKGYVMLLFLCGNRIFACENFAKMNNKITIFSKICDPVNSDNNSPLNSPVSSTRKSHLIVWGEGLEFECHFSLVFRHVKKCVKNHHTLQMQGPCRSCNESLLRYECIYERIPFHLVHKSASVWQRIELTVRFILFTCWSFDSW